MFTETVCGNELATLRFLINMIYKNYIYTILNRKKK